MIKIPRINRVGFLVSRKFPGLHALLLDDRLREQLDLPILTSQEKARIGPANSTILKAIEEYRSELSKLDEKELEELYQQELYEKKLEEDQERFFNDKSAAADFDYWSKMSHWTLEEAVALSFGKNPEIVFSKRLESISSYQSPFVSEYRKLIELARRAVIWKKLFDPMLPPIFIGWTRDNDIDFPEELSDKVIQRNKNYVDWKQKYNELLDSYKEQAEDFSSHAERIRQLIKENEEMRTREYLYMPPYIEFMLKSAEALELSPEKRTGKNVIVEWLKNNWPDNLDGKSDRIVDSMATLLRSPEHKKGGNTSWKE